MNAFSRPRGDSTKLDTVKRWCREAWGMSPDAAITITQLKCTEPDCPPIETAIVLWPDVSGRASVYRIHKSLEEITMVDIAHLRRRPGFDQACDCEDCAAEST